MNCHRFLDRKGEHVPPTQNMPWKSLEIYTTFALQESKSIALRFAYRSDIHNSKAVSHLECHAVHFHALSVTLLSPTSPVVYALFDFVLLAHDYWLNEAICGDASNFLLAFPPTHESSRERKKISLFDILFQLTQIWLRGRSERRHSSFDKDFRRHNWFSTLMSFARSQMAKMFLSFGFRCMNDDLNAKAGEFVSLVELTGSSQNLNRII